MWYNSGMVRLINKENMDFVSGIVYKIMHWQEQYTHIIEIDNPGISPCIYAMWHANQFLIYGIRNREDLNVLISNSIDGEIIARTVEKMGFSVVRGSAGKRGAVEATMHMISLLKKGKSICIMVDGPSGPLHKVKNGAIKLAQKTGAPIIPVHWYSAQKTFVKLPSWDKMTTPFYDCNLINVYGKPVYISENADDKEISEAKSYLKEQLYELEAKAPELYKEAKKNNLWKK